jgi:2-polyprenyl-3-methyl-5-hydroxy-6-metoxy-1,4-benzoquinol methylase
MEPMVDKAIRGDDCPICGSATDFVLQLQFNSKMSLPKTPEIRHCASDNFLFVASGSQANYDEYYKSLANDTVHAEVSGGSPRSMISKRQQGYLVKALDGLFEQPRTVFDFGCGEASLLVELASEFPSSTFFGFDPGPAAQIGSKKATILGLENLSIADMGATAANGPFDLVIASHVVEHPIDFDVLHLLKALLADDGFLYIEVPNSLDYEEQQRQEFLYYFDRLHVNHFAPQSLARLAAMYGFAYVTHFNYTFPYRDGGEYPALGILFRKGQEEVNIRSPNILEGAKRYISREQDRAKQISAQFDDYEGVLVWGAGDNFFRSMGNGGPLSGLRNIVVLDRRAQEIAINGHVYSTMNPAEGIQSRSWPVIVTVSEARKSLVEQVKQIDSQRNVFFV